MSSRKARVEVLYSPSCPFSFRDISQIRKTVSEFGNAVTYEEIDTYKKPQEAEKRGYYGLFSKDLVSIFIDGEKYEGNYQKDLKEAINKHLERHDKI